MKSISKSDKRFLASWLVFILYKLSALAEPAEPSQGFRPLWPTVPPDLNLSNLAHKVNPYKTSQVTSHISMYWLKEEYFQTSINAKEGQTHNLIKHAYSLDVTWHNIYKWWQDLKHTMSCQSYMLLKHNLKLMVSQTHNLHLNCIKTKA